MENELETGTRLQCFNFLLQIGARMLKSLEVVLAKDGVKNFRRNPKHKLKWITNPNITVPTCAKMHHGARAIHQ